MKRNADFEYFLKKDFTKYSGKWVAICNKRIISSSVSVNKVMREARAKCSNRNPIFAKIPSKNQALIL